MAAWTGSLTCSLPTSPGQVSTQRAILEVQKHRGKYKESVDAFVEEAVVRRELAENFCYYNENYDSVQGSIPGRVGNAGGQAGTQVVTPIWQSHFC